MIVFRHNAVEQFEKNIKSFKKGELISIPIFIFMNFLVVVANRLNYIYIFILSVITTSINLYITRNAIKRYKTIVTEILIQEKEIVFVNIEKEKFSIKKEKISIEKDVFEKSSSEKFKSIIIKRENLVFNILTEFFDPELEKILFEKLS